MGLGNYDDFASFESEAWHWYVLVGYPVVSVLGMIAIGRFTSSMVMAGLSFITLLTIIFAFGFISLPALHADIAFVRTESDEWQPESRTYVGAAIAGPLLVGIFGVLAVGFGAGLLLMFFSYPIATIVICIGYLYNRRQAIGLLSH